MQVAVMGGYVVVSLDHSHWATTRYTIFVDPTVKVHGAYYYDLLLSQQLIAATSGLWRVQFTTMQGTLAVL